MEKKKELDKAAKQLADLIEGRLDGLSASKLEAKSRAFHKAIAKIGTPAKSVEPRRAI